jgi:hypothetical protein
MNRLFLIALSACVVAPACSSRPNTGAPPPPCAVDSVSLAQTARAGLEARGLPAPNADAALEVTQRPVRTTDGERLFITASWGGPSNGAVLWADCSGTALDGEASGYILAVEPVAPDPGRTLIKVRAITGTGSGWKQESIHLYAPSSSGLTPVWSGVVAERSYQAAAVGAYEEEGDLTYVDADSLVYSSARFPVAMSSEGTWRRDTTRVERTTSTYDWNAAAKKYEVRR